MVMELCEGGELGKRMKKGMSESLVQFYLFQLGALFPLCFFLLTLSSH